MSLLQIRGGPPQVRRETVTTTGSIYKFEAMFTWVHISNDGANPLRVYFRQEDFDAGINYVLLAARGTADEPSVFAGPLEQCQVYLRTTGGNSDASITAALRLN